MSGGLVFSLCVIFGCLGYLLGYWVRDAEVKKALLRARLERRLRNVVSLTEYRFKRRGAAL